MISRVTWWAAVLGALGGLLMGLGSAWGKPLTPETVLILAGAICIFSGFLLAVFPAIKGDPRGVRMFWSLLGGGLFFMLVVVAVAVFFSKG